MLTYTFDCALSFVQVFHLAVGSIVVARGVLEGQDVVPRGVLGSVEGCLSLAFEPSFGGSFLGGKIGRPLFGGSYCPWFEKMSVPVAGWLAHRLGAGFFHLESKRGDVLKFGHNLFKGH